MKYSLVSLTGVASLAGAFPATAPLLSQFANSFIQRGANKNFHYTEATLYLGIEASYQLTKNESVIDWVKNQIDAVVLPNGTIDKWNASFYSLDEYRSGNNYLYFYKRTGDERYKKAADVVRQQINRHPRTPLGGFWHRQPVYPNQMWLDGIFMADSFYAKWTRAFDLHNQTAWDDIILQYDLIEERTRINKTGLLVHGYDESKVAVWADPVTGAAPHVWDRAVGWYFLSLVETLTVFPKSHPGYKRLLFYYTSLAQALKTSQDTSGGWWLIMTEGYAGRPGNYIESSATAMFTAGWLQGIRLGLLPKATYLAAAKKAYALLVDRFVVQGADGLLNWEGTVSVGSLSSNGTYEYYISVPKALNDYKGAGPFMLAAFEWESWASKAH